MKLFTKLLITAALSASFASAPASAGPFDFVKKQAEKEAKKAAKKKAKEEAAKQIVEHTGASEGTADLVVDGGEKALEVTGVIEKEPKSSGGGGLLGKVVGAAKSGIKTPKTSSDDASMKKETVSEKTEPAPKTVLPPVACPEGTTAQPNGTCMMTDDS